jgi:uncharacterized membrane-anchored protein YitT (DUF2179 family)
MDNKITSPHNDEGDKNKESEINIDEQLRIKKRHIQKRRFKTVFQIVLAAFTRALALELLLIPNNITLGGAVGIASILTWIFSHGSSVYTGAFLLAVNIPLIILAYFKTEKGFALKTAACLVLTAVFMEAISLSNLAGIIGTVPASGETKVLYTFLGGALSGISLPMMLSIQASTGGSDIVTMLLQQKRNSGNYLRVILYIDVITIVIAAAASQWLTAYGDGMSVLIYSVSAQFVAQLVQNQIYKGYSSAYGFDIITDKAQEVSTALQNGLGRGLTGLRVTGMYSHTDKTMIMCVVYKRQLKKARALIKSIDPNAFAIVYNVKEVVGVGFRNTDEEIETKVLHSRTAKTDSRKK